MAKDDKVTDADAEAEAEAEAENTGAGEPASKAEETTASEPEVEVASTEGEAAPAEEEAAPAEEEAAPAEDEAAPAEDEAVAEADEGGEEGRVLTDLAELGGGVTEAAEPESLPDPVIDDHGRSYATGKRKDAVARVWIKPGSGQITVNDRLLETYFARPVLRMIIGQPFATAARVDQYDVVCTVKGGGLSGQAGAVRHGISKALTLYEPVLRKPLKAGGFLTRDSRVVERKKYGRHKARRSHQFSKR